MKINLSRIWAAPLSARTITLAIAILSTIATALSSVTDPASSFHTTPEQALLISSIGAGLYAFVRALQKIHTGESLKSIFASSETKGVVIVYIASAATALKGVVPPAWAGAVAAIATALTVLSRALSAPPKSGDGGTTPKGAGGPPTAVAGLVLLVSGLFAPVAWSAPKVQLGGCNEVGTVCWQPAVAVSALQLNLATMDYERVALGAGYGLVYKGLPVNLGVAGYLGAGISKKTPNAPQMNLLFSVADLGAAGPGVQVYKDPVTGKPVWEMLATLALNLNVGGTTTYVEKLIDSYEHSGDSTPAPVVALPTPPDAGPVPSPAPPVVPAAPDAAPTIQRDAGTGPATSPDAAVVPDAGTETSTSEVR